VPLLLEAVKVSKHFPGVQALDRVSLSVHAGEVLAVVGENGAGKSTLMKVLAGIYQPDEGQLFFDGQPVRLTGVRDALGRGISLIHQELNLAENLSVGANLFLGREMLHGRWLGILDRPGMRKEAQALLARVGLACSPQTTVSEMPLGQRQLVEIARALSLRSRLLIMDEPTSSLTQRETDRLFGVVGDLRRSGVAVVYISHRLGEVQRIADRVVVLRDGRNAGELQRADISHAALVRLMVGRDLQQFYTRQHHVAPQAAPRLEVRGVRFTPGPEAPVSLVVRRGEIVGLAGLVGAGRTELAEALFGLRRLVAGEILLDGRRIVVRHPREAVAAGLLLVPEDRRAHGLVIEDTVAHNIGLSNLDRLSRLRLVSARRERLLSEEMCRRLGVRSAGLSQPVAVLSGGNQQKVVLGKWLARSPRVLIFDEPTRGIDVGAKAEIYALMDQLAGEGVAILMISSDLEEVLGISDRVLVMKEGRIAGELPRDRLSEEAVMRLATEGGNPP
jgi:ribose transport system ATP-binding protein